MLKLCQECDREFNTQVSKRLFCSRKCSIANRKKDENYLNKLKTPKKKKDKVITACKYCGKDFKSNIQRKYCSTTCNNRDRLLGKGYLNPIECKECNKEFKPVRSSMKYCSQDCAVIGKLKDPNFIKNLKEGCSKRSQNQDYLQKLMTAAKLRWETPKFKEKMKQIFDSDEWLTKSTESYLTKDFYFPSGRIEKIQGYEDKAINDLLKSFPEEEIIVNKKEIKKLIGKITYMNEGKEHQYIPDIYIKSKNKIIEVKSEWTYQINQKINDLKKEACLDRGFEFSFMIY